MTARLYKEILSLRDELKAVSQISWDINVFEKRYPISNAPDEELPDLLSAYQDYACRVIEISQRLDKLLSETKATTGPLNGSTWIDTSEYSES